MALNMAVMMAAEKDVAVYLDIKGIELVLRDAPDVQFDGFPSSLTSLQALQKAGVMVMACPGCLKAAGKTPEDLMPLAHAATKECFFSFTQGRILTLDY
jgi:intracellular sulfur oxidation DsrE/DsrF family protein